MKVIVFIALTLGLSMIVSLSVSAQQQWYVEENPIELGQIHWLRNLEEAKMSSKKSGLPIFLLFQEVPGCSNCTTYGYEVLSHPFIVEIIESNFVPLAIFNNKGGKDKEVLKRFEETSWNNPVVRIITQEEVGLVPRLSSDFSQLGLAERIRSAMIASNQVVPQYFQLWLEELKGSHNKEEAFLSMFCFWTGEREIAKIPGVLSTEAGFMHGKEVVRLEYDSSVSSLQEIAAKANKMGCADEVYSNQVSQSWVDRNPGAYRKDKQVKYYLSHTQYKSIPMTKLQAAKVNTAISEKDNPDQYLSPRQLALMNDSHEGQSYINQDFVESWYDALGYKL